MCPAITAPQVHAIFSDLLRNPAPSPAQIAAKISEVLRRNEEARIYAWHQRTGGYPPLRPLAESG